jgi:hypothetical protein
MMYRGRATTAITVMIIALSVNPAVNAGHDDEPNAHLHFDRHSASRNSSGGSPLMTYHGGTVLHASRTAAVFWGTSWTNASFAGDKMTGMDRFFDGFGGSEYAGTDNEYSDSAGLLTNQSTYTGHLIDPSSVPNRALRTSQAIAEICKLTNNSPDPNTAYFIFTSTSAGNVNYCAWHTWGSCANGAPVQVAYIPNLDGVAGCNPGDTVTGNSEGLAAIANVSAHELMETLTDPRGTSWYDPNGNEIGDKCAWAFPPGLVSTLYNGAQFVVQMEWSNNAYKTSAGYANLSGQKGCIF